MSGKNKPEERDAYYTDKLRRGLESGIVGAAIRSNGRWQPVTPEEIDNRDLYYIYVAFGDGHHMPLSMAAYPDLLQDYPRLARLIVKRHDKFLAHPVIHAFVERMHRVWDE